TREEFDSAAYAVELAGTAKYPIQSRQISRLVQEILKGSKSFNEKVWRLLTFVSNTLIDDYMANSEDAIQILNRHIGDCTEHAILFVTLARAAGIPAREVLGVVYNDIDEAPGFGFHAWVEVALDGNWVGLDPSWGEGVMAPIRIKVENLAASTKINNIEIIEKSYKYTASSANYTLANNAFKKQDYKKSFSLFHALAEKGDSYSQYSLGWAFEHGEGVSKDYKKAYDWYLKAAQQGNASAEYRIGLLYSSENRLGNNSTFAAFWFERSAKGGDDRAAYYLAEAYETGTGMPKDKDLAIEWYKSAASSIFN
ncbi:lasso peptide biosynthesis protein, partial [Alphaproteobacteria bacterium]|nr:lasso peptide biosynthesis protein [Alphaproteobacteria bacterium]